MQAECLSLARSELPHFCSVIHPFSLAPAAAYIALEKLVWGAELTENLYVALLVVCWFCSLNLVHFDKEQCWQTELRTVWLEGSRLASALVCLLGSIVTLFIVALSRSRL